MNPLVVSASGLTKQYGPGAGVFELDLEIPSGRIIGLIGPSGSGKTVTVRLMTGVLDPDAGRVEVLGEDPRHFDRQTRARIGYMPQHTVLSPDLSLRQNLNFAASLYGMPYRRKERMDEVTGFLELDDAMDRKPDQASGGEKRRLMLASAMIHKPELVFLDEPTAGIDPVLRRKFWDRFEDMRNDGRTLIVTTQYVGEAAHCDLVAVLSRGRVLLVDTPEGLRRRAYGGELLDIHFAARPENGDLAALEQVTEGATPTWLSPHRVRLVVDDAAATTALVARWADDRGVELTKTEPYLPSFDDVFVELVTRLDEQNGNGTARVA